MGDVADAMLDGTLCAQCGVFLNEEPQGYPCYCCDCGIENIKENNIHKGKEKVQCPTCLKWVKKVGLDQHIKDKHTIESVEEFQKVTPGNYVLTGEAAQSLRNASLDKSQNAKKKVR